MKTFIFHETYKINHKIFDEFSYDKKISDDYWNLYMNDWTPMKDDVTEMKQKWSEDMYNLTLEFLNNDEDFIDTVNYKASMLHYNDGFITEHFDNGYLTMIYNVFDGLELYIDNKWIDAPKNGLIIFGGKLSEYPILHRVNSIKNRFSLNFFAAPSNVEYMWTYK